MNWRLVAHQFNDDDDYRMNESFGICDIFKGRCSTDHLEIDKFE